MAATIAITALNVLIDEKMADNAEKLGEIFRSEMKSIQSEMIETVRGKGLLNAVAIKPDLPKSAWDICLRMKENGVIAKPTHEHIIRFTPPLVINEEQIRDAIGLIKKSFREMGI